MIRLLAVASVVGVTVIGTAGAAQAQRNTTIDINPGNVPTTAAAYTQECSANLGGGPYPDQDVWVFNLPAVTRDFVQVTASYSIPNDGETTRTIPDAPNSAIVRIGTSKAWIILPAGWTLLTATAEVTGEPDAGLQFVLTHTCAASGTPTPTNSELPITGTNSGNATPYIALCGASAVVLGGIFIALRRRRGRLSE